MGNRSLKRTGDAFGLLDRVRLPGGVNGLVVAIDRCERVLHVALTEDADAWDAAPQKVVSFGEAVRV